MTSTMTRGGLRTLEARELDHVAGGDGDIVVTGKRIQDIDWFNLLRLTDSLSYSGGGGSGGGFGAGGGGSVTIPYAALPEDTALTQDGEIAYQDGDIVVLGKEMTESEKAAYDRTIYAEIGGAFVIGLGLRYGPDGLQINWNSGFGAYGTIGMAENADAARDATAPDPWVLGVSQPSIPTYLEFNEHWQLVSPMEIGGGFGFIGRDYVEP